MAELSVVMLAITSKATDVLIYGLLVVGIFILFGAGVLILRRVFISRRGEDRAPPLSLETLEELRIGGQISDEEFKRLRKAALGLDGTAGESDNPPLSASAEEDDNKGDAAEG